MHAVTRTSWTSFPRSTLRTSRIGFTTETVAWRWIAEQRKHWQRKCHARDTRPMFARNRVTLLRVSDRESRTLRVNHRVTRESMILPLFTRFLVIQNLAAR